MQSDVEKTLISPKDGRNISVGADSKSALSHIRMFYQINYWFNGFL